MTDGPLSFQRSWEGFLPPDTIIMTKRGFADAHAEKPIAPAPLAQRAPDAVPLRFGFEAPGASDPEARALLDKILSALELPPGDFAVSSDPHGAPPARFTVRLTSDAAAPAGGWDGNVLTTYSLRTMLGNPGLKKAVWTHLKDAIARGRHS